MGNIVWRNTIQSAKQNVDDRSYVVFKIEQKKRGSVTSPLSNMKNKKMN
jgi:hypothetical protein